MVCRMLLMCFYIVREKDHQHLDVVDAVLQLVFLRRKQREPVERSTGQRARGVRAGILPEQTHACG